VGEAIADDSDEIRPQMYAACQEARASGKKKESFKKINLSPNLLSFFFFL
jgi:hypothetical protein